MSAQTRVSHPIYNLLPTEIDGFDSLAEPALDMRPTTGGRVGQLRTQCGCVHGPPASGLYGASDTALRRRFDPTGGRTNPVAAMIRSSHP